MTRKAKEPNVIDLSDEDLLARRARRMSEIDSRRQELAACDLSYIKLTRINEEIRRLLKDVFCIDSCRMARDELARSKQPIAPDPE